MTAGIYTDEQLFELGKENYDKLALYCQTLETSGFWDKARQVMQQSSTEVLDMYVQSVLDESCNSLWKCIRQPADFYSDSSDQQPFCNLIADHD